MGDIGTTIKIHDIPKPIKATPFTQPEIIEAPPERVLMPVKRNAIGGRIYAGPCNH